MTNLFFYGTLRHRPLLETVLGRAGAQAEPAALADHAVYWVRDEPFPTIVAETGAAATGLLARGLSETDIARLRYYEGGFDYDLRPVTVRTAGGAEVAARVFFPAAGKWAAGAPWSLEDWAARWGAISLRAAQEAMAHFGRLSAQELAARFTGMRRRAASWVAGQTRPPDPQRDLARDVIVHANHRPYVNFFAVEEIEVQYRQYDGQLSPIMNRSSIVAGQAAAVLPYDPTRDTVLLIEQFRAPVLMSGDRAPWVWEPVAGLIDPGETPEVTAHREALEEAGVALQALEPVGRAYSSVGNSTEFLHLFIGLADLSDVDENGGMTEEGEDIRVHVVGYETLMAQVDADQHCDLKLVTMALWLARHRERLRARRM